MPLPADYAERVYAGVLGKIIGVYLGRPFESWTYDRIMRELGEITGYVHERRGVPLVVTDDDISGTFTFLRALPNYGNRRDLSPEQIGRTWLNYIIENKTILWWGGMGNSTEHTAFLRLKRGIPAPRSGSIALNGTVVAEQIGSQIFIDGWAMVAPGDPEFAVDLARRASLVSHDGEAIYGAQVIAAMESQAFVERDIAKLIDIAVSFIPKDSIIYRMIDEIREWHVETPDWRTARELLARNYGYDRYGGNCHMVPNHGVIMLALLYGNDDFRTSLMIANTSGWDTDCNSGNLGCLLGIKNGLAAIDSGDYDWRGPVADRLFLPTADGGRAISDALTEAYHVVNIGRTLAGEPPVAPKGGARFHFSLPGSVQGFMADPGLTLTNVPGTDGIGRLALHLAETPEPKRAATATFTPPDALQMAGYTLLASPTLYAGQTIRATLIAEAANSEPVSAWLFVRVYTANDDLELVEDAAREIAPGSSAALVWTMPETGGQPIAEVGIALQSPRAATLYLDRLAWDGEPQTVFCRPEHGGKVWRRAWVEAVDGFDRWWPEAFRIVQNDGRGMVSTGTREWQNYRVTTTLTPHLCDAFGVAARVQGLGRYYALLLVRNADGGIARLIKVLDGEQVLMEQPCAWQFGSAYTFELAANGERLVGRVGPSGGTMVTLDAYDRHDGLEDGGIALLVEDGRVGTDEVLVEGVRIDD